MEENLRDIKLVHGYFDRSLTPDELHELEYRLKEEPALKALFNEHKLLVNGIRYSHLKQQLEQLRALDRSADEKTGRGKVLSLYWKPVAIAASLLIAAVVWHVVSQPTEPLNERLYVAYFEPFDSPGPGLSRGTDNEIGVKAKAYIAYDAGNYAEAEELFQQALKTDDNPIMHLCLGNVYLQLDKFDEAETTFEHILTEHAELVTQATWYLALTNLKKGQLEKAKSNLWEISKSSTYGEKARKLLKDLN
ncbi:MAG: tetratricopeptide repeat protein [Cyclobacteriaceae bacterium]